VENAQDGGATMDGNGGEKAPTCENYCQLISESCKGEFEQYPSEAFCESYCKTYAAIPIGEASDTSGNTVGCRSYHSTVAATDPGLHCPHSGKSGGNVCGNWCTNYCHLAMKNCTGSEKLYDTEGQCFAVCGNIRDDGNPGDVDGDSIQCRIEYLGAAGTEPPGTAVEFCPAGSLTSNKCR